MKAKKFKEGWEKNGLIDQIYAGFKGFDHGQALQKEAEIIMKAREKGLKDFTFTIIPNELLEAFFTVKMSATQFKICLYILRKTYGWHRDTVAVSLSQFVDACDSIPQWISVQIQELIKRKIIIRCENKTGRKSVYKINDNTEEWIKEDQKAIKKSAKKQASHKQTSCDSMTLSASDAMIEVSCKSMTALSYENMTPVSCESMMTDSQSNLEQPGIPSVLNKESKKDIKKEKKETKSIYYSDDSLYYVLAKLLLGKILFHLPEFMQPDLQQWAKTMQLIIEKDKRNPETVRKVINFSQQDPFWRTIILDAASVRNKFDHLNAKRLSESSKHPTGKYDEYEIFSL